MSIWATKRRLGYIAGGLFLVAVVVVVPTFFVVYRPPTCTDGKINQGEQGIDCGGPCKRLCPTAALEPIVSWRRFFTIAPGQYSALAYIQNPNVNSMPKSPVQYTFKLYDKNNVLLAERKGEAVIYPNRNTPIFESGFSVGNLVPSRVSFELNSVPEWVRVEGVYPNITATDPLLTREETSPKLEGFLVNKEFSEFRRIPVIAIVYDVDGNAIAASRTVVDYLGKNERAPFYFTWPNPFPAEVGQREFLPLLNPIQ